MILTEKQKAWDATKAADREDRRRPMDLSITFGDSVRTGSFYRDPRRARGVRTPVMPSSRPRGRCVDCPHGWKHHTKQGRCRLNCHCKNGANR